MVLAFPAPPGDQLTPAGLVPGWDGSRRLTALAADGWPPERRRWAAAHTEAVYGRVRTDPDLAAFYANIRRPPMLRDELAFAVRPERSDYDPAWLLPGEAAAVAHWRS
ncbi:MAG: hypothetical protein ACI9K2_003763 [Myxococcota bacterium]